MGKIHWQQIIAQAPDPERSARFLDALFASGATNQLTGLTAEQARSLVIVLSASEAISQRFLAAPHLIKHVLEPEALQTSSSRHRYMQQASSIVMAAGPEGAQWLAPLAQFKEQELIKIAVRDLVRYADLSQVGLWLAWLADAILNAALEATYRELISRLGLSHSENPDRLFKENVTIIGLGKLGGLELNYHSDVDILLLYDDQSGRPEPYELSPAKRLAISDLFHRLATAMIDHLNQPTPVGRIYKVDLRLRPDAPLGALIISSTDAELYYEQRGQVWERLMLIKARGCAGSLRLAEEFLEAIQPFRYPKSVDPLVLEQILDMKQQLERRLGNQESVSRNLKYGPGGIREVEFVVQGLQFLHGGKNPFLQESNTLKAIERLARYELLSPQDAAILSSAYVLLRELEHRIQLDTFRQTHELPQQQDALCRLAKLTGFEDADQLLERLSNLRTRVRTIYESFLPSSIKRYRTLPDPIQDQQAWLRLLESHSFRDPVHSLKMIQRLVYGPGFQTVSVRTHRTVLRLIQRILNRCIPKDRVEELRRKAGPDGDMHSKWLSDPDRVLTRLVNYLERYGARTTLLETWGSNPEHFEMIVYLFDRSEFLAELAIEEPDLIEDLSISGRLLRRKTVDHILREIRYGLEEQDQSAWIRRYHKTEFMRIGLRDILGLSPWMQSLEELSNLAEACLQYALEVAARRLNKSEIPIAVIGLGKLGGAELNYGSDLDILLVAPDEIDDLYELQELANRFVKLIAERTVHGIAFVVDTRLRPDGEKGLLVNTLKAYEDYYLKRARLWEIQTLCRARHVAGNRATGHAFLQFAQQLISLNSSRPLSAWSPDWVVKLDEMRRKIQLERTPKAKELFSLKTGAGGLMDVEFIAQLFCLQTGQIIPNTLAALQQAHNAGWLADEHAERLIPAYLNLRRIEAILRRWSYQAESELPDDPAPLRRVAIRCGFVHGEDLLCAVQRYKNEIRSVYEEVIRKALSKV